MRQLQDIQPLTCNDDLWVYDKPAGVPLLADRTAQPDLWSTLKDRPQKPYLVHRLDKGTSGILLVARNQRTQSALTSAFNQRSVKKFYLAWVVGDFPRGATLTIDLPLRRGRKSRKKRIVDVQTLIRVSKHVGVRTSERRSGRPRVRMSQRPDLRASQGPDGQASERLSSSR